MKTSLLIILIFFSGNEMIFRDIITSIFFSIEAVKNKSLNHTNR